MEHGTEDMAGRRKGEGIALLSVYADEDEEDVDMDEEDEVMPDATAADGETGSSPRAASQLLGQGADTPSVSTGALKLHQAGPRSLGIVDYAQDEAAMSPEPEDREEAPALEPGIVHQVDSGDGEPRRSLSKSPGAAETAELVVETEVTAAYIDEAAEATGDESVAPEAGSNGSASSEALDLVIEAMDDFLPPAPAGKCSEELQSKFAKYLALKNNGRSFNGELRNSKGYRNPDFLQRAVRHQEIDQIGSCFKKEVFDPHGYDPGDYYDAITAELNKEMERKEQERKQSQRLEFIRGSVASVVTPGMPDLRSKPIMQLITGHRGLVATSSTAHASFIGLRASGSLAVPVVNGEPPAVKTDGRSKRSKWDKVEQDGKTIPSVPPAVPAAKSGIDGHGVGWRNRHASGKGA